jgi:SsrA-binding protein
MAAKLERKIKVVADNRRARFNYEIGESFEAGIALTGSEVKSLRQGRATIAEYRQAGPFNNHAPKRSRKLLLHARQINRLAGAVEREGMTIVPLKLYFNERGRAKLQIALAKGKKLHDKRETLKKRSWERERGRLLRQKG